MRRDHPPGSEPKTQGPTTTPMTGLTVAALILSACGAQPAATLPAAASPTTTPQAAESATATVAASPTPSVGEGEEWIVFQGAPLGLSFIRPDGTGNHVILGPPGDQVHPDWSPDGSQIVYVQVTDEASEVWITDPQGANPVTLLAEYPDELSGLFWDNPAWSRDGTAIAMIGYEGHPQLELPTRSVIAIVDVATDELSVAGELTQADGFLHSFPRWSPDGDALVIMVDQFTGEEFIGSTVAIIRRTDAGWSEPQAITDVVDPPRADWHPTDDLIVFCTNDVGAIQVTDEPSELFTVRSDGSELTQITDYGPGGERASQPTWTPDGRIIFDHITGDNDELGTVAFINADGSGLEIAAGTDIVGEGNRPHPRLRPVP
jgi:dipeptidyl aminopeptidase/acylaminoacyl peptidase